MGCGKSHEVFENQYDRGDDESKSRSNELWVDPKAEKNATMRGSQSILHSVVNHRPRRDSNASVSSVGQGSHSSPKKGGVIGALFGHSRRPSITRVYLDASFRLMHSFTLSRKGSANTNRVPDPAVDSFIAMANHVETRMKMSVKMRSRAKSDENDSFEQQQGQDQHNNEDISGHDDFFDDAEDEEEEVTIRRHGSDVLADLSGFVCSDTNTRLEGAAGSCDLVPKPFQESEKQQEDPQDPPPPTTDTNSSLVSEESDIDTAGTTSLRIMQLMPQEALELSVVHNCADNVSLENAEVSHASGLSIEDKPDVAVGTSKTTATAAHMRRVRSRRVKKNKKSLSAAGSFSGSSTSSSSNSSSGSSSPMQSIRNCTSSSYQELLLQQTLQPLPLSSLKNVKLSSTTSSSPPPMLLLPGNHHHQHIHSQSGRGGEAIAIEAISDAVVNAADMGELVTAEKEEDNFSIVPVRQLLSPLSCGDDPSASAHVYSLGSAKVSASINSSISNNSASFLRTTTSGLSLSLLTLGTTSTSSSTVTGIGRTAPGGTAGRRHSNSKNSRRGSFSKINHGSGSRNASLGDIGIGIGIDTTWGIKGVSSVDQRGKGGERRGERGGERGRERQESEDGEVAHPFNEDTDLTMTSLPTGTAGSASTAVASNFGTQDHPRMYSDNSSSTIASASISISTDASISFDSGSSFKDFLSLQQQQSSFSLSSELSRHKLSTGFTTVAIDESFPTNATATTATTASNSTIKVKATNDRTQIHHDGHSSNSRQVLPPSSQFAHNMEEYLAKQSQELLHMRRTHQNPHTQRAVAARRLRKSGSERGVGEMELTTSTIPEEDPDDAAEVRSVSAAVNDDDNGNYDDDDEDDDFLKTAKGIIDGRLTGSGSGSGSTSVNSSKPSSRTGTARRGCITLPNAADGSSSDSARAGNRVPSGIMYWSVITEKKKGRSGDRGSGSSTGCRDRDQDDDGDDDNNNYAVVDCAQDLQGCNPEVLDKEVYIAKKRRLEGK